MLELCSGELFAGCKIVCVCGKGGYGTVYLAENAAGEKVALKIINTNEQKRELEGIKNYLPVSHQSPYLLKHKCYTLHKQKSISVSDFASNFTETVSIPSVAIASTPLTQTQDVEADETGGILLIADTVLFKGTEFRIEERIGKAAVFQMAGPSEEHDTHNFPGHLFLPFGNGCQGRLQGGIFIL